MVKDPCCQCCVMGRCGGVGSTPGPGNFACCGHSQKKFFVLRRKEI